MSAQQDMLNSIGIEAICERIEDGETYRAIAKDLGIGNSTLTRWLNLDANKEQSARALLNSAESWLDRGLDSLEQADGSDQRLGAEITRARAIAQECARRAAIRNPKYSDKQQITVDATINATIKATQMSDEDLIKIASQALPKK